MTPMTMFVPAAFGIVAETVAETAISRACPVRLAARRRSSASGLSDDIGIGGGKPEPGGSQGVPWAVSDGLRGEVLRGEIRVAVGTCSQKRDAHDNEHNGQDRHALADRSAARSVSRSTTNDVSFPDAALPARTSSWNAASTAARSVSRRFAPTRIQCPSELLTMRTRATVPSWMGSVKSLPAGHIASREWPPGGSITISLRASAQRAPGNNRPGRADREGAGLHRGRLAAHRWGLCHPAGPGRVAEEGGRTRSETWPARRGEC